MNAQVNSMIQQNTDHKPDPIYSKSVYSKPAGIQEIPREGQIMTPCCKKTINKDEFIDALYKHYAKKRPAEDTGSEDAKKIECPYCKVMSNMTKLIGKEMVEELLNSDDNCKICGRLVDVNESVCCQGLKCFYHKDCFASIAFDNEVQSCNCRISLLQTKEKFAKEDLVRCVFCNELKGVNLVLECRHCCCEKCTRKLSNDNKKDEGCQVKCKQCNTLKKISKLIA